MSHHKQVFLGHFYNHQPSNDQIIPFQYKNQLESIVMNNFFKDIDRMNRLISDISHFSTTIAEIEIENFELTNVNKFLKENFSEKSTNKKNIKITLIS
mgnify:CR=1 FL=1